MIIASFCIPTYNRGSKVYDLIQKTLSNCSNVNFEIIVLDNLSNDNTSELLNSIIDKRFRYFVNEESIIGPLNIIKSLSYANGKYTFLCLDKDFIDFNYIDCLIDRLNSMPNVAFGYCSLNLNAILEDSFYLQGFESLYNMSYLSAHPTGMFYNTDLFKTNNFYDKISDPSKIFGFYPDILNAEMAILGSSSIIRIPVFNTESIIECEEVTSYTFKSEEDLFFTPNNRSKHFLIYSDHLLSLNISNGDKIKVLEKIYLSEVIASTIGYKIILENQPICKHYYISTRKVGTYELIRIYFHFTFNFFKKKMPINNFEKLKICFAQTTFLFLKLFIKTFKLKLSYY
jgi:glycosyltransferase involved in cell wall biosynthesis